MVGGIRSGASINRLMAGTSCARPIPVARRTAQTPLGRFGGRCWPAIATALSLAFGLAPSEARAVEPSAFTQLTGIDGCVMQIRSGVDHGCARTGGLSGARGVTVSSDGRHVYVASGGSLGGGSNGIAVFRRDAGTGALTPAGCVTANGGDGRVGSEGTCAHGDALLGAADLALSPDGRTAYVAAAGAGGLAWLARDVETGRLDPLGCLKDFPRADRCGEARHLSGAAAVAVSPDGLDVYVASPATASLHALRRGATGALTPVQCVSETGLDGACETAAGLQEVRDVAVSPDGRAVYAAGGSGAVAAFSRDVATGRLSQTGCLLHDAPESGPCEDAAGMDGAAGVVVSPDGRDVYVAARGSEAVVSFRVQPDGGLRETACLQRVPSNRADGRPPDKRCRPATALWEPHEIVVSSDGRVVFAGGLDTITSYRRDPSTGTLTQMGCAEEQQSSESCLEIRATFGVNSIATTTDGRNVYVTSDEENAVAILGAAVTIRSSALRSDRRGRVQIRLSCPEVRARPCSGAVRAGRGDPHDYRVRVGARVTVPLRLASHARQTLKRAGRVRVGVRASDREQTLHPTHRVVLVRTRPRR